MINPALKINWINEQIEIDYKHLRNYLDTVFLPKKNYKNNRKERKQQEETHK